MECMWEQRSVPKTVGVPWEIPQNARKVTLPNQAIEETNNTRARANRSISPHSAARSRSLCGPVALPFSSFPTSDLIGKCTLGQPASYKDFLASRESVV